LKSDDVVTKQWAYVLVCRFIAAYETPSKIILQVLFALLRIHSEGKELIKLSLDILIPVLPDRLKPEELLKAMRFTKKVVVEEGHTLPQLLHIWNIIIRHADIFYPFRSLFIQLMSQSIGRLGLIGTCPLDQRQVAVGVADVIVEWEWFRQNQLSIGKQRMTPTLPDETAASNELSISPN
jgi:transformation/transcription domain-associated protein